MKWAQLLVLLFSMMVGLPVSAMQVEPDPRMIISSMDRSVSPELDILRVTADVSPDNRLVFEVKTRGERIDGIDGDGDGEDYLLLQILHEKAYVLFIPVSKKKGDRVLIFEGSLQAESHTLPKVLTASTEPRLQAGSDVRRIFRGAEFTVPVDWIDFGGDFSFDAYTVKASIQGNTLIVGDVYDQARKSRAGEKRFSAITLLNKICTPRGLRSAQ
jgi:hypothetical protein